MAMRELVTGGVACAVPGSSSSNPFGALANSIIGSPSKTQERLREVPTATTTTSEINFYARVGDPFAAILGSELEHAPHRDLQDAQFIQRFCFVKQNRFSDAWDEIQTPRIPHYPCWDRVANFPLEPPQLRTDFDGPPQRVLSNLLHSFIHSNHGGTPLCPTSLPLLGLSDGDKQCICDRSSILARHFFTDKGEDFIHAQVNVLLSSLEIDNGQLGRGHMPRRFPELEDYWNESQGMKLRVHPSDGWVDEVTHNQGSRDNPNLWVQLFEQQHGANGWASEFEHDQLASVNQMRGSNVSDVIPMEQTQMLALTLAQNSDPKFQNSRFLQFVSKMSRGETIIEDNKIKSASVFAPEVWATEHEQQYGGGKSWVDEFSNQKLIHEPDDWANEFATGSDQHVLAKNECVNEYSKLNVNDWLEEFEPQIADGTLGDTSAHNRADVYDEYLTEQSALKQKPETTKGVYAFSDLNPLKERQEDLFHNGLLSEATLALEAEVLKNPDNAEGWRLLGIAHAENYDDQKVFIISNISSLPFVKLIHTSS